MTCGGLSPREHLQARLVAANPSWAELVARTPVVLMAGHPKLTVELARQIAHGDGDRVAIGDRVEEAPFRVREVDQRLAGVAEHHFLRVNRRPAFARGRANKDAEAAVGDRAIRFVERPEAVGELERFGGRTCAAGDAGLIEEHVPRDHAPLVGGGPEKRNDGLFFIDEDDVVLGERFDSVVLNGDVLTEVIDADFLIVE